MPKISGTPKTSTERAATFSKNMKAKGLQRVALYVPIDHVTRIKDLVEDIKNGTEECTYVQGYRQCRKDMQKWDEKMFMP